MIRSVGAVPDEPVNLKDIVMTTSNLAETPVSPSPELEALKVRQRATWSSGNYAVVGTTLQIVGEQLGEALDLRSGQTVLDVAAGNGNAAIAAARRYCDVTATDYVPALLEGARRRAEGDGLSLTIREADAEALPFPTASFDAVTSVFGVMFTADHDRAAAEMVRVLKPAGKLGMANWTPWTITRSGLTRFMTSPRPVSIRAVSRSSD